MGFRLLNARFLTPLCLAGFIATVAGCQSDDATTVLDPNTGGGTQQQAPEGKVLQSELRAYCPQVTLRSDATVFNTYEKKKSEEEDPAKLVFRSSISAATRKCSYAPGSMTMDVAVAGRVVPGPLAKDGTVTMPIKIEVKRGDEVLYSNVAKYEVAVNKASGATQFIYNDPNVTFPTPEPGTLQVYAGYDLGPPKKKAEEF